jgi:predicted nucleic acid binding AN1-type Zn finger protein
MSLHSFSNETFKIGPFLIITFTPRPIFQRYILSFSSFPVDFLPYTCSGCKQVFCQDHWKADSHNCPQAHILNQDARVPVCPLCQQPVPVPKGANPNIHINIHMDAGCQKKRSASGSAIYTFHCQFEGCKGKEAVKMGCKKCTKTFCKKHRLEMDHKCQGPPPPSAAITASLPSWMGGSSKSGKKQQAAKQSQGSSSGKGGKGKGNQVKLSSFVEISCPYL